MDEARPPVSVYRYRPTNKLHSVRPAPEQPATGGPMLLLSRGYDADQWEHVDPTLEVDDQEVDTSVLADAVAWERVE
jgi:hypothetical protein